MTRLSLLVCAFLLLQGCESNTARRVTAPNESDPVVRRCEVPDLKPSYLPWGRSPPPRHDYDEDIDRAAVIWTNPEDDREGVALTVYPLDEEMTPEKPLGVTIEGAKGYLHEGSVGEHSAWWNLDADCNFLELSLSLPGRSPREVDREVVRVARALR